MPGGDRDHAHRRWLIAGAIILGVPLSWLLLWALSQYQADYVYRQQSAAAERAEGARSECYTALGWSFCFSNDQAAEADAKRAEDDLQAQQDMAEWAKWITLFTGLQIAVGGIGIYYVRNTLLETRRIGQAQVRTLRWPAQPFDSRKLAASSRLT